MTRAACSCCPLRQRPCGGPCACTISGVQWTEHRERGYCPHPDGPKFGTGEPPVGWDALPKAGAEVYGPPRPPGKSLEQRGRELWEELHRHALLLAALPAFYDHNETAHWLEKWEKKLPCGECKEHWAGVKAELPPDLATADAFFRWGVAAHNAVNRILDKPEMNAGAARERWG